MEHKPPMLRAELCAHALCASQTRRELRRGWARYAPDEWAGRERMREWKGTRMSCVISEVGWPRNLFVWVVEGKAQTIKQSLVITELL